MKHRIVLVVLGLVSRVDRLHTQVETQDEIVEVQAQAQSIADSQLTGKILEAELSAGLFVVLADGPDITGIHEEGSVEFPEQVRAILGIQVELHITRLVDEVDTSVLFLILSRSQRTHGPSTHTIGTTGEIAFFKGHHGGVAIGIGHAKTSMENQLVVLINHQDMTQIQIALHILRKGDVKHLIMTQFVFLGIPHARRQ